MSRETSSLVTKPSIHQSVHAFIGSGTKKSEVRPHSSDDMESGERKTKTNDNLGWMTVNDSDQNDRELAFKGERMRENERETESE